MAEGFVGVAGRECMRNEVKERIAAESAESKCGQELEDVVEAAFVEERHHCHAEHA